MRWHHITYLLFPLLHAEKGPKGNRRRLHAGNILMNINSSVIPENLVLLTKSEQSGPKTAHIRPTSRNEAQTTARLPVQTHGC